MNLPALRANTLIDRLEKATELLAEADIALAQEIIAVGKAAEEFARVKGLGEEGGRRSRSVTLRAQRKLGELLKEAPKNSGQIRRGSDLEPREKTPTLEELGVDKKESMVAQQIAALPQKKFDEVVEGKTTVRKALAEARADRPKQKAKAVAEKAPTKDEKPKAIGDEKKLRAELVDLQGKYAELLEKHAELKDSIGDLRDSAASAKAFEEKGEFKEMQVLRLELRSCKRRRDELMAENAEMKKMLAYWKKKAEKK